jgi:acetyltransferase-like isoleucine patch superfamily enzyme
MTTTRPNVIISAVDSFTTTTGTSTGFNPVHYLYLNPELQYYSNITSVEDAYDHFQTIGEAEGLLADISIPSMFRYRIYNMYNSNEIVTSTQYTPEIRNFLTADPERQAIIHYLREGQYNPLVDDTYSIPNEFNELLYRTFQKVTSYNTEEDLYIEYIQRRKNNEVVLGKFEDFTLLFENYRLSDFRVRSNLIVDQEAIFNQSITIRDTLNVSTINLENELAVSDIISETVEAKSYFKVHSNALAEVDATLNVYNQIRVEPNSDYFVDIDPFIDNYPALYVNQLSTTTALNVVEFRVDDHPSVLIANDTYVGIHTDSPTVPLDITGETYIRAGDLTIDQSLFVNSNVTIASNVEIGGDVSIYKNGTVSGTLTADEFFTSSDERIKTQIVNAEVSDALNFLNQMAVKTYKLMTPESSHETVYGMIGQELAKIKSSLVKVSDRYIPLNLDADVISMSYLRVKEHKLEIGDEVTICQGMNVIKTTVQYTPTPDTFFVASPELLPSQEKTVLYGKRIRNFHSVDYIQIINLLIVCIQDLYKRLRDIS